MQKRWRVVVVVVGLCGFHPPYGDFMPGLPISPLPITNMTFCQVEIFFPCQSASPKSIDTLLQKGRGADAVEADSTHSN